MMDWPSALIGFGVGVFLVTVAWALFESWAARERRRMFLKHLTAPKT